MATKDQQQTPPDGANPTPNPGQTEEQRIAEQRLRDLMQQASDAAAGEQEAKRDLAGVRGELERANAELVGARATIDRLSAENKALLESSSARDSLPSLPVDLPRGAYQLSESVTIAVVGDDGKPARPKTMPKRGDVVVVGAKRADAAELQAAIGQVASVFLIDKQTLDELRTLKHVRAG